MNFLKVLLHRFKAATKDVGVDGGKVSLLLCFLLAAAADSLRSCRKMHINLVENKKKDL
jgi:hypothetical protein